MKERSIGVREYLAALLVGTGALCTAAAIAQLWAWHLRYMLRTTWQGALEYYAVVPSPGAAAHAMLLAGVAGFLAIVLLRTPVGERRGTARRLGSAMLLFAPTAVIPRLLPALVCAGTEPALWLLHVGLPVLFLVGLVALGWAVLASPTRGSPYHPRAGKRLWLLFFLLVHFPSLWFARPWRDEPYRCQHMGGDEPRYLLVTHSLAEDRDFNIYNNLHRNHRDKYICPSNPYVDPGDTFYAERAAKWGAGAPHNTPAYWHKRRYSKIRLGLPLLLAPAYHIGRQWNRQQRYATIVMLNIVLTFTMANIFLLAVRLTKNRRLALVAAVTGGLSGPLLFYGVAAYPEPVAAALLVFCVRKLVELRDYREGGATLCLRCRDAMPFALALAYMPWIHEKMIPLCVCLLALFFAGVRPSRRWTLTVLLAVALSVVLQMAYYHRLYGQMLPEKVHAEPFRLEMLLKSGLWGLLFDQARGGLPVAPWLGAGLFGLGLWAKQNRRIGSPVLALVVLYILVTGAFGGWSAGKCAAPRYLTTVMPLIATGLAVTLAHATCPGFRSALAAFCILGVIQGVAGLLAPDIIESHRTALLRPLFPNVFELDAVQIAMLASLLGLWLAQPLLLCPSRAASLAWGSVVFCAGVLVWAATERHTRRPADPVIWGTPAEFVRILSTDKDPNTFNRRIKTMRRQRALSANAQAVLPLQCIEEREKGIYPEGALVRDTAASAGAFVRWQGEAPALRRANPCPLWTLFEGRYNAEFRVRATLEPATPAGTARIALRVARAGENRVFGQTDWDGNRTGEQWQYVAVPFTLRYPTRLVSFDVLVQGRGRVDLDCVRLSYLGEPDRTDEARASQ